LTTKETSGWVERIPGLEPGDRLEYIPKGYSDDDKFIVHRREGVSCLLRTCVIGLRDRKKEEYEALGAMKRLGVNCSRPLAFGELPELGIVYQLLSYMEGEEAAVALPVLPQDAQYRIGFEAGEELKRMNGVEAPTHIPAWEDRLAAKFRRNLTAYADCGTRLDDDGKVLAFIEANLHLLADRPNRFQHDDFHVGNLVVRDGRLSGVIDFNRFDWGDPVHEFLKAGLFSAPVSIPFAVGQVHGYHGGEPDGLFWRLYALYLAMNVVGSVPWIRKVKPEETGQMIDRIHAVLAEHRWFELDTPLWYSRYGQVEF